MNIIEIIKPESDLEKQIITDPEWQQGALWGEPREGHPEGQIILHIADVLKNVDKYVNSQNRGELRLIALIHDTFKYKVDISKSKIGENHHAMIARRFAEKYNVSNHILEIIELHDEAFNAWSKGSRDNKWNAAEIRAKKLIERLGANCDLFITFFKCDNETGDKQQDSVIWFNSFYNKSKEVLRLKKFNVGDVVYSVTKDNKYSLSKILKIDSDGDKIYCYHINIYKPLDQLPAPEDFDEKKMKYFAMHVPVDGLIDSIFLINRTVHKDELQGYYAYLQMTNPRRYAIETDEKLMQKYKDATDFFDKGNKLAADKKYLEAIDLFKKSVELVPDFYEALDNMAFAYLDAKMNNEALIVAKKSLDTKPNGVVAMSLIAEAYFHLMNFEQAKEWFNKVQTVEYNPNIEKYLAYIEKLQNNSYAQHVAKPNGNNNKSLINSILWKLIIFLAIYLFIKILLYWIYK